jgi:hypothetical protein
MENVAGVDLTDVGELPMHRFNEIYEDAVQVLNSLEYFGVEHKSISARNIMINYQRQLMDNQMSFSSISTSI